MPLHVAPTPPAAALNEPIYRGDDFVRCRAPERTGRPAQDTHPDFHVPTDWIVGLYPAAGSGGFSSAVLPPVNPLTSSFNATVAH